MDDLTITRLCAEAMKLEMFVATGRLFLEYEGEGPEGAEYSHQYDPLHDDAQAMALVKKFALALRYTNQWIVSCWYQGKKTGMALQEEASSPNDLNRAICECVAKMQSSKGKR